MSNSNVYKVLLVDDDKDHFDMTREMISLAKGKKMEISWACSYEAGQKALSDNDFDVVLIDYDLGERTGLELTREITSQGYPAPIILFTGRGSYDIDIEAMRAGAADYLSKAEVTPLLLERSIRHAVERKQNQEALIQANTRLAQAMSELEERVEERTRELTRRTEVMLAEIAERERVEGYLAEVRRRLLDRVETERLELSRELHDGPMQDLYGLIYDLAAVAQDSGHPQIQQILAPLDEKIQAILRSLRSMAGELRPPALAPFGVERAIRAHATNFQEAHPEINLQLKLDPDEQSLTEQIRLAIYRIYQMAMTNIIRHAQASQVAVRFSLNDEWATLEIEDNGCGFERPPSWYEFARQGHLGLAGAAERAEAVGGSLEVRSDPGAGTLVRVVVPKD